MPQRCGEVQRAADARDLIRGEGGSPPRMRIKPSVNVQLPVDRLVAVADASIATRIRGRPAANCRKTVSSDPEQQQSPISS